MIRTAALLAALTLAACGAPVQQSSPRAAVQSNAGFSVAPANAPSGPAVDAFARDYLNTLQARSFAGQREYCGYFFIDRAGFLQATPPRAGSFAGCDMPAPRRGEGIVASYHTHGSYDPRYDNEVPSTIDLVSDFEFGIDGYVSTPGGRVWLVDFQTRSTRQICGLRCVMPDPNFRPQNESAVRASYTLPDLQRRAAGGF